MTRPRTSLIAGLLALAAACPAAEGPGLADARIAEAQRAMAAGHVELAHDRFVQAAVVAPGDPRVLAGLAQLARIRRGQAVDPADEPRAREAQRAVVDARRLVQSAEARLGSDPATARDLLTDALHLLRTRDPEGAAAAQAAAIAARLAELQPAIAAQEQAAANAARIAAATAAGMRATTDRELAAERRRSVLDRIRELAARDHFDLALRHVRDAFRLYPDDAELTALWEDLLGRLHEQRRLSMRERDLEMKREMMRRIEQDLMPTASDGLVAYAPDWLDRVRLRTQFATKGIELPAWESELRDRLNQVVTLDYAEADAVQALRALAAASGINIILDNKVAASERKLSLVARRIRLDHAIDWIARLLGTQWSVAEGGVFVGGDAQDAKVLVVHDATVLGIAYRDFPPMRLGFPQGQQGAGGAGAGAPNLFGGGAAGGGAAGPAYGGSAAAYSGMLTSAELIDLVKRVVEPTYWTANADAGLAMQGGLLLVTASPRIQRMVGDFIRHQALLTNLMVHCNLRWLALTDVQLERIGVNWISSPTTWLALQRQSGLYQLNSNNEVDGSILNPLPFMRQRTRENDQQSLESPTAGLNAQIGRLGDPQVSAVLQAHELTMQTRELRGLDLVTLNGLQSTGSFIQQIAYIAGYGSSEGNLDPTIRTLNVGASITMRPRVSADRKYILADIQSSVASAELFQIVIDSINVLPTDPPVVLLGQFPIELPLVRLREVATTVRVPDKGSLLVGGYTNSSEQRSESRVPLLADIPFLGRVFGTRGRLSDRYRLYLMATFVIIDLPEQESLQ